MTDSDSDSAVIISTQESAFDHLSMKFLPKKKGADLTKSEIYSLLSQRQEKPAVFFSKFKDNFHKIFYDSNANEEAARNSEPCSFIKCIHCSTLLLLDTEHHKYYFNIL